MYITHMQVESLKNKIPLRIWIFIMQMKHQSIFITYITYVQVDALQKSLDTVTAAKEAGINSQKSVGY